MLGNKTKTKHVQCQEILDIDPLLSLFTRETLTFHFKPKIIRISSDSDHLYV